MDEGLDVETAKAYAPLAAHALIKPKENFEEAFGAGNKPGRPVYFLGRGEASRMGSLPRIPRSPDDLSQW